MSWSMKTLFFLFTFFLATTSFANNPGVSYQGRIFKPDGNPLEGTTVQFRMQVRSPGSENCLLYEEVQTLNMAGSSGVFALTLNDGTGTRLDTATYQVDRIFANRETMTLDTTRCATGTTYTPNSSDGRKLVVYFKDETMAAYEAMPLMNLNYVPQAMYALEAQKLDKFEVSSILRAVDGSGNPATAPALNPTQLLNLNTLLATPAANYVQTTSNGSAALPIVAGNPSSGLAAGQIWYDSGSNVMKYYDGAVKTFGTSGGGVTSIVAGTGLTGGTITTSGTIAVDVGVTTGKIIQVGASDKLPAIDGSNLTNITGTDATKLPLAGGTMTGPLVNNSSSASTALAVTQAGAGYAATFMGGNVGIGTLAPTALLDVNGAMKVRAASYYYVGSGGGVSFYSGSAGYRSILLNSEANGLGGTIKFADGSAAAAYDTRLGRHAAGTLTLDNGTDGGAANLIVNGNVGIGTASPVDALDVISTSNQVTMQVANTSAGASAIGGILFSNDNPVTGTLGVYSSGAATDSNRFVLSTNQVGISIVSGGLTSDIRMKTNAGEVMRINSSGNVGVGTASPTKLLHIVGDQSQGHVKFERTSVATTGTLGSLQLEATSSGDMTDGFGPSLPFLIKDNAGVDNMIGFIAGVRAGADNTGDIVFNPYLAGSGSERMRITSSGNVGIGTTSPGSKLDVTGVTTSSQGFVAGGSDGGLPSTGQGKYIASSGNGATISGNGSIYDVALTNKSTGVALAIPTGTTNIYFPGNVGIGTTTPVTVLNTSNTNGAFPATSGSAQSSGHQIRLNGNGNGVLDIGMATSGSGAWLQSTHVGSLAVNYPLLLNPNGGNVGIGTTSPQTTLQVAGIISPAVDNTTTLGSATYRFTTVYATNGTINTSDRREKKDIYDTDLGLDFINKLRPVSYRWNTGIDNDVHYGLIAQEAEQVIDEIGKGGKTSIVTHDETTDRYGVRYSELISPLIKAVQELYKKFLGVDREIASVKTEANAKSEKLEAQNTAIKQENAELKARLDQQEKELTAQKQELVEIKSKLGL